MEHSAVIIKTVNVVKANDCMQCIYNRNMFVGKKGFDEFSSPAQTLATLVFPPCTFFKIIFDVTKEREKAKQKKKKKGKIVLKSRAAAILHFRRNSTIRWRRNRNSLDSLLLIFVDWRVWVMVSLNKWTHIKRISILRSEKRLWATSSKQKRPKLRFKAERNCRVVSLMKKTHFLLRREKTKRISSEGTSELFLFSHFISFP